MIFISKNRVVMVCSDCLERNYRLLKNENKKIRLNLRKYCPKCRIHTLHKETR